MVEIDSSQDQVTVSTGGILGVTSCSSLNTVSIQTTTGISWARIHFTALTAPGAVVATYVGQPIGGISAIQTCNPAGPTLSGQVTVTTSVAQLSNVAAHCVCLKASVSNTANVYVGPSGTTASTGMELAPGDALCTSASNLNQYYAISGSGSQTLAWLGN
jgi:hypothetical protein